LYIKIPENGDLQITNRLTERVDNKVARGYDRRERTGIEISVASSF